MRQLINFVINYWQLLLRRTIRHPGITVLPKLLLIVCALNIPGVVYDEVPWIVERLLPNVGAARQKGK